MDVKCVSESQGVNGLFRAHAGYVRAFLLKLGIPELTVDDSVQDVFLVVDRLGGYRAGPASQRTWLGEITLRVAANARRKMARYSTVPIERVLKLNSNATPPDVLLIQQEELADLDRALQLLNPELHYVFLGFYVTGDSCESIAAALGIPVGTVYSRLHAARHIITAHIRGNAA